MNPSASISTGDLMGIWRVGELLLQTQRHQLHLAQPADSRGSNRWSYVIRSGDSSTGPATRAFLAAAGAIEHPGLISVADGSADAATPFVVMPRMTRDDSGAIAPSLPVVLWAARQVAQTLAAMHAAGWVHGDVRPGHVLGNRMGHAMLIDLDSATPVHSIRRVRSAVDPSFTSPEALSMDHAAVTSMDVFSLGRTLWSWLAGVDAEGGDLTDAAVLVERMVDLDPAARPSMETLVDELSQLEFVSLQRRIAPIRFAA